MQGELTVYEKLRNFGIDTHLGLEYCQEDEELYESLLRQFVSEYPGKREKIEKYYLDKDFKNYEIYVHALKSTSKMIGNMVLSEQSKDLEFAAKDKNAAYIESHHDALLHAYQTTMERIASVYEIDLNKNKNTGSTSSSDDVMVFSPEGSADEEVMVFSPAGEKEVMEFSPGGGQDDEVLVFAPKKGDKK